MVRHALSFEGNSPSPASALRELIEAVAEGWFERSRRDAILSLIDDRDRDFELLMLLGAGVPLSPAVPLPGGAHEAVARYSLWDGRPPRPDDLHRLITCHALVRHGGDRRAALRRLVEQREGTLVTLLKRVGVEL